MYKNTTFVFRNLIHPNYYFDLILENILLVTSIIKGTHKAAEKFRSASRRHGFLIKETWVNKKIHREIEASLQNITTTKDDKINI